MCAVGYLLRKSSGEFVNDTFFGATLKPDEQVGIQDTANTSLITVFLLTTRRMSKQIVVVAKTCWVAGIGYDVPPSSGPI